MGKKYATIFYYFPRLPMSLTKWFLNRTGLLDITHFQSGNIWTKSLQVKRWKETDRFASLLDLLTWHNVTSFLEVICKTKYSLSYPGIFLSTRQKFVLRLQVSRKKQVKKCFKTSEAELGLQFDKTGSFWNFLCRLKLMNTILTIHFRPSKLSILLPRCGRFRSVLFFNALYILRCILSNQIHKLWRYFTAEIVNRLSGFSQCCRQDIIIIRMYMSVKAYEQNRSRPKVGNTYFCLDLLC